MPIRPTTSCARAVTSNAACWPAPVRYYLADRVHVNGHKTVVFPD